MCDPAAGDLRRGEPLALPLDEPLLLLLFLLLLLLLLWLLVLSMLLLLPLELVVVVVMMLLVLVLVQMFGFVSQKLVEGLELGDSLPGWPCCWPAAEVEWGVVGSWTAEVGGVEVGETISERWLGVSIWPDIDNERTGITG